MTKIKCKECGQEFEVSDKDMDFFNSVIYDQKTGQPIQMKPPKRCPECRRKRAQLKNNSY